MDRASAQSPGGAEGWQAPPQGEDIRHHQMTVCTEPGKDCRSSVLTTQHRQASQERKKQQEPPQLGQGSMATCQCPPHGCPDRHPEPKDSRVRGRAGARDGLGGRLSTEYLLYLLNFTIYEGKKFPL